jgi:hypothetical protein
MEPSGFWGKAQNLKEAVTEVVPNAVTQRRKCNGKE